MVAAREPGLDLERLLEVLNASSGVNFATLNRFPRGAAPDTVMTHLAISLGTTDWGDPVSDSDYTAAG